MHTSMKPGASMQAGVCFAAGSVIDHAMRARQASTATSGMAPAVSPGVDVATSWHSAG